MMSLAKDDRKVTDDETVAVGSIAVSGSFKWPEVVKSTPWGGGPPGKGKGKGKGGPPGGKGGKGSPPGKLGPPAGAPGGGGNPVSAKATNGDAKDDAETKALTDKSDDNDDDGDADDDETKKAAAAGKAETGEKDEHQKDKFLLSDIAINAKPGTLVQVIGAVGSGKSSLFHAILRNMLPQTSQTTKVTKTTETTGSMQTADADATATAGANGDSGSDTLASVHMRGKVAFAPQTPWIRNVTFRDNILFGQAYDEEKYERVIEVCCLTHDRELLPAGDDTEIGEKGINMSGGQKQRISLARAVYSDADIFLLDDTLSAVDVHVGKKLFFKCILGLLIAQGKTVLLASHQVRQDNAAFFLMLNVFFRDLVNATNRVTSLIISFLFSFFPRLTN
jgi:ABC-type Mn2+/Zn2+ transport system ATPase subunit